MNTPRATRDIRAALADTTRRQGEAADPRASVWVSANAGTGKTHVLSNRVLRLLLDGTPPERILCLTYTKAAAAEMSKRVFDKLAVWTKLSDHDLGKALQDLTGMAPATTEMALARTLFARAIETPGGLKVQTIHAFAERILKRFPLEAGVSPDFAILDEETSTRLLREATDDMLARAAADREAPLGRALQTVIAHASENQFDQVLKSAIHARGWLDWMARLGGDAANGDHADLGRDPIAVAEPLYRRHFGVAPDASDEVLLAAMANVLGDAELRHAITGLAASDGKSDLAMADALIVARDAPSPAARVDALRKALLKKDGEPKADNRFVTLAVRDADPSLHPMLARARDRLADLAMQRRALSVVAATLALARLALDVMQIYAAAKARRAALDFDDLIAHTARLLGNGSSVEGAAEWVLFKLDGGLTHILVDESQDTSPTQWAIVEALTEGFFAAAGGEVRPRTLFAVGDEKQSIYSFQGAAPHLFAAKGAHFARRVSESGHVWRALPLTLSFRTVAPVLAAVDAVFTSATRTPGLGEGIRHEACRVGHAGVVELWETEKPHEVAHGSVWAPLEEEAVHSAADRLAARIAGQIDGWLKNGEMLPSEGRRVTAGDILILVRKRRPFAQPMVAALKARGIPVAGADRMRLSDQIGVADLIALGDFLTLPEDDLSLAVVLKSPLFGLDDDDLIRIAPDRKRTLWKALADAAGAGTPGAERYREAVETLRRWRKAADFDPPFEFLANLLDRDGMRKRFIARLGSECADGLDELLSLAITYDESAPPSLPGFLTWLRESDREVKRDMEHGRDEVRVMTVHGAKGLEAPIVFMPDTCMSKGGGRQQGTLTALPRMVRHEGAPPPLAWPVRGRRQAGCHPRRQRRRRPRRNRGAQSPALRRHDARPRPPLRMRLRGQVRHGPRQLAQPRRDRPEGAR